MERWTGVTAADHCPRVNTPGLAPAARKRKPPWILIWLASIVVSEAMQIYTLNCFPGSTHTASLIACLLD